MVLAEEENHKVSLNFANGIEKEFSINENDEFPKKLTEIIRDIDNLGDSSSLLELIRLLNLFFYEYYSAMDKIKFK